MSKKNNFNYIANLEKAIAKKYGHEAVVNPKSGWNEEKEKEYLLQIKEFYEKERKISEQSDKIDEDGFFIAKHLINKKSKRSCPVCDVYSFDMKDNIYLLKHECCFKCYVQYVEDREQRWQEGWRPTDGN